MIGSGEFAWSEEHERLCRVVDVETLWGSTTYTVWLPEQNIVARVAAERLRPLDDRVPSTPAQITYVATAAKVAEALTQDAALAPLDAAVIPLPHQIHALERAISSDEVRYLLADEVGLGKTVEAGLIMRELKLRGLVQRTLVVAPKGLVTQWVAEMRVHFGEEFRLVVPSDVADYRRAEPNENIWHRHDQIVCTMDSVKPLDRRRGWSQEQVAEYNGARLEDLIMAGWDLIIVDEAHRLGGSTDAVARYKLGQGLAQASPYFLLLSATPHQGKTDAFHRLIALLDERAFPDLASFDRDRVRPYVIRTQKRRAVDTEGKPLFKPRQTEMVPVAWDRYREQRVLYEAVTDYVREGYSEAQREKKHHVGFLMILMQRLVTSSTRAIRSTLERRLEVLRAPLEQVSLIPGLFDDWEDLDGQQQIDVLLHIQRALHSEMSEVEGLLALAQRAEDGGADAKADALLEWMHRLQQQEGNPELKFLIFTEFVSTQEMLNEFLADRGFSVVCLNGRMDLEGRQHVQDMFASDTRVLVSTDAGGEGLNLQFCHVVINFDIPWNPMRLEQRIGRVDRIGQIHSVRALNFVLEDTVEHRVREVLEQKLAVILHDLGVDKAGDVLDSAQAGQIFDDLYVESILRPDGLQARVEQVAQQVREQANAALGASEILGSDDIDLVEAQRVMDHPLPQWVERMTMSYLRGSGGTCERRDGLWNLTWPDGMEQNGVVFTPGDATRNPTAPHLTLDDTRVRALTTSPPVIAPGQPIACTTVAGLPDGVCGIWSLWRITVRTANRSRHRIMPLFQHDNGRVFVPTARFIWDALVSSEITIHGHLYGPDAQEAFEQARAAVEAHGETIFGDLLQTHRAWVEREREKGIRAFAARRQAIQRLGLPNVRVKRLAQLSVEEWQWRQDLERQAAVTPGLQPLLLIRVEGATAHDQLA